MGKLGLIAGDGKLPVLLAREVINRGQELAAITVTPEAEAEQLEQLGVETYQVSVGQLAEVIATLHKAGVEEVVMLGKVSKELLYQGVELDSKFEQLLASLPDQSDDTLLVGIAHAFQEAGLEVKEQAEFIADLLPAPGVLTESEPTPEVKEDMGYGFRMAKEIGSLDIGQTVVVKDKAVMAVEAVEGTDQAILRGGRLGKQDVVVAKVSKPNQDLRFDLPTVGLETLENLIEVEAKGLVIEANKTFIINQTRFIERAEEAGIFVKAIENDK